MAVIHLVRLTALSKQFLSLPDIFDANSLVDSHEMFVAKFIVLEEMAYHNADWLI